MTPADRADFATTLTRALEVYGPAQGVVTDGMLETWWSLLRHYKLAAVRVALTIHLSDPERGGFPPRPADIIRHLTKTIPTQMQALAASEKRQYMFMLEPIEEAMRTMNQCRVLGVPYNGKTESEIVADLSHCASTSLGRRVLARKSDPGWIDKQIMERGAAIPDEKRVLEHNVKPLMNTHDE